LTLGTQAEKQLLKIVKCYVGKITEEKAENKKKRGTTMYIKNRRISSKIKACSSFQALCLTESLVLRSRQQKHTAKPLAEIKTTNIRIK
jgi:hypothetical protein